MATFLRMPGVSADSDAAVLDKWYLAEGESVQKGQPVICVETEKALVDVNAEADVTIHKIVRHDGETVTVGDPVGVLLEAGDDAAAGDELLAQLGGASAEARPADEAPSTPAEASPASEAEEAPAEVIAEDQAAPATTVEAPAPEPVAPAVATPAAPAPTRADGERLFVSPLARKIAAEHDIDLESLSGSGPRGRIRKVDVLAAIDAGAQATPAAAEPAVAPFEPAAAAAQSVPEGGTAVPNSKLRRLVASRLQQSKRDAPHFYLKAALTMDALLSLRKQLNEAAAVKISVNDLIVKAAARALVDVPELNVTWTDEATITYDQVDVAVAVASEKGLVTPVFRNVAATSLTGLASAIKDAVVRANEGRLQQNELEGGTLTISNLGMFGVDEFSAIINPPHAAILAVGAAKPQIVVGEDGQPAVATLCTVTLSVDHRAADGAIAAQWLARFREIVENPLQILI